MVKEVKGEGIVSKDGAVSCNAHFVRLHFFKNDKTLHAFVGI